VCDRPEIRGVTAPRIFASFIACTTQATNLVEIDGKRTAYGAMNDDEKPQHVPWMGSAGAEQLTPDQALALDFALGILVAPLRDQAAHRCAHDPMFAELVTIYQQMIDQADKPVAMDTDDATTITPSARSWAVIQARIAEGKRD
jgi:hypothetical protein